MPDEKRSPAPDLDIPDLVLPAKRVSTSDAAPVSGAVARGAPVPPSSLDDDLGMELERDVSRPFEAPPPSRGARPAAAGSIALDGPRPSRPSTSGLDVSYDRLAPRARRAEERPSRLGAVLGPLAALVLAGGAFAGLLRVAHRPAGRAVTGALPMAFDGSSAIASGAVALSSLVLAVALGTVGVRAKTKSWLLVGAASLVMLLSLAMVTVTLASSGETSAPPDGALLVPWLAPFAMLLGGIDVVVRGARAFVSGEGAGKLRGLPVALVGGALVFLAVETSRFSHLLPSLR